MSIPPKHFYVFGPFRLNAKERVLLRNGQAVPLTPKVAETLLILVENAGHLVEKDELMQRVWPDAFVEEGNLSKNIYTLRKLLGHEDDGREYIETLPKRGYRFAACVKELREEPAETRTQPPAGVNNNIERLGWEARATPLPESKSSRLPAASESSPAPQFDPEDPGTARYDVIEMPSRTATEASSVGTLGSPLIVVSAPAPRCPRTKVVVWACSLTVIAIGIGIGTFLYIGSRATLRLTDKDTIVLADFTNTTGDPVFDGTLRQGLSAQLEQSPFLNLLSDDRIAHTLGLMRQPKDARLTHALAREVCLRTGSAATVEGSISSFGGQYIVGLRAVNCNDGDLLAQEQVTANGKERVIKALGEAATKLRAKFGESLASIKKYDALPESITTASLEALQAYSLGRRAQSVQDDWAAAIPLFQRAINRDPNFAMAYARLGMSCFNSGETARGAENTRKAYELRDRVSDREKFYIDSHYQQFVVGDLESARKTYELWARTYPRDPMPRTNLGSIYSALGEYEMALNAAHETLILEPGSAFNYSNVVAVYLSLNRPDEAEATMREARAHKLDSELFYNFQYLINFLRHDRVAMERDAGALIGKPGFEDIAFFNDSDTAAYAGQFAKAREFTRRAAESAERAGEKEVAAGYEAEAALREALVGNRRLAKREAQAALALSDATDVEPISTIALGLAGDSIKAVHLASDLDTRFPKDTVIQSEYLPLIRAAILLGSPGASKDIGKVVKSLGAALPYELGTLPVNSRFALYPAYLRAEAYLDLGKGSAAAAEFQKILDHPGIALNEIIGALAYLGIGRGYALEVGIVMAGRVTDRTAPPRESTFQPAALSKARTAYQDFFALWKDADPDIPALKQAKAEYARLK